MFIVICKRVHVNRNNRLHTVFTNAESLVAPCFAEALCGDGEKRSSYRILCSREEFVMSVVRKNKFPHWNGCRNYRVLRKKSGHAGSVAWARVGCGAGGDLD